MANANPGVALASNCVWTEDVASRYPNVVEVTDEADTTPLTLDSKARDAVTVASLDNATAADALTSLFVISKANLV